MSKLLNELRKNNTSGVPGLRLNVSRGHLVIDVHYYKYDPSLTRHRKSTTVAISRDPLRAVERALRIREENTGARYDVAYGEAWARLIGGAVDPEVKNKLKSIAKIGA